MPVIPVLDSVDNVLFHARGKEQAVRLYKRRYRIPEHKGYERAGMVLVAALVSPEISGKGFEYIRVNWAGQPRNLKTGA